MSTESDRSREYQPRKSGCQTCGAPKEEVRLTEQGWACRYCRRLLPKVRVRPGGWL